MPNHNKEFTRDDCIWIHERDDMIGKLERIEAATVQIPMLVEGVKRINGTIAKHESELITQGKVLEVLKDHDGRGVSIRQAVLTAALALVGALILLVFKGMV